MRHAPIDIKVTIRGTLPRIPFEEMARAVLGNEYELSLVICGDRLARAINTKYRQKTYSPNVLSFPLNKDAGEIFLNVRKSAREAHQYGIPERERLALLFVHGLLHLVGMDHGRTMEDTEQKLLRQFRIVK